MSLTSTYFIRIFELFLSGDHRSVLLLLDELMGKGFEGQTDPHRAICFRA